MIEYAEYNVFDNGFGLVSGEVSPLGEIWGLSNRLITDPDTGEQYDERFTHLGYTGYPEGAAWLVEQRDGTGPVKCLAAFEGAAPAGGTAVAEEDVVALLISDYGWPEGVTLRGAALPVAPEAE